MGQNWVLQRLVAAQQTSMVYPACRPIDHQHQGATRCTLSLCIDEAIGCSDQSDLSCCRGKQTQRGAHVQGSQVFRGAVCKAAGEGAQQETASFAEWEQHTRGIASRIMARLGYVQGRALGQRGSGLTAPLQVNLVGRDSQIMDKLSLGAHCGACPQQHAWSPDAAQYPLHQGRSGRAGCALASSTTLLLLLLLLCSLAWSVSCSAVQHVRWSGRFSRRPC